jgi:hypothetical protein
MRIVIVIAATITMSGDRVPIITCDECNTQICDPYMAMAVMPPAEVEPLQILQVLHIHKDTCYDAFERKQGHCLPWIELQEYLVLLGSIIKPHQMQRTI